jgi:hypothetical protein
MMHVQHDAHRILVGLGEKTLQNVHDELHGSVIVVQHQNLVHRRLLRLGARLGDDAGRGCAVTVAPVRSTHRCTGLRASFEVRLCKAQAVDTGAHVIKYILFRRREKPRSFTLPKSPSCSRGRGFATVRCASFDDGAPVHHAPCDDGSPDSRSMVILARWDNG